MTAPAIAFIIVAGLFAVGDWVAKARKNAARKWDPRLHGIGAQILKDLNVGKMRVLARPKRIPSMSGFGLEIVEYVSPGDATAVRAAG